MPVLAAMKGSGLAQVFYERGLIWRDESIEDKRAARGWHVGGVDVVFDRDGDAVQRAASCAARAPSTAAAAHRNRSRLVIQ